VIEGPSRGPPCTCGCMAVEHERFVGTDWRYHAGRCLTCSCQAFELDETVAGFEYDQPPDGPAGP